MKAVQIFALEKLTNVNFFRTLQIENLISKKTRDKSKVTLWKCNWKKIFILKIKLIVIGSQMSRLLAIWRKPKSIEPFMCFEKKKSYYKITCWRL